MLHAIFFILIASGVIVYFAIVKDLKAWTAVCIALLGLFVLLTFDAITFYLLTACFALIHILRLVIKILDKQLYNHAFSESKKTSEFVFSHTGMLFVLVFVCHMGKSTTENMTYNVTPFVSAFFACFASAFAVEVNYVCGALLGGTFNPISRKKTSIVSDGSTSLFAIICALLSVFISSAICYKFTSSFPQTLICGICGLLGLSFNLIIGALMSKNDQPILVPDKQEEVTEISEQPTAVEANEENSLPTLQTPTSEEDAPNCVNAEAVNNEEPAILPVEISEAPSEDIELKGDTTEDQDNCIKNTETTTTDKQHIFSRDALQFVTNLSVGIIAVLIGLLF